MSAPLANGAAAAAADENEGGALASGSEGQALSAIYGTDQATTATAPITAMSAAAGAAPPPPASPAGGQVSPALEALLSQLAAVAGAAPPPPPPPAQVSPTMEALLAQMVAGQGQILAALQRISPPQQQQQQQHSQQQLQSGSAGPAGGILAPLPQAATGDPTAPAVHAKAQSAGAKLSEKRQAAYWNTTRGPMHFLLKGGFDARSELDFARLRLLTKDQAYITEQAADQILSLSNIAIEHFFPPLAPGLKPAAMPAQVHFRTFVSVLMIVIEYGMEDAPDICLERVKTWRRELHALIDRLDTYLQLHYSLLAPFGTELRDALLAAINEDIEEGFHTLGLLGCELHRRHGDGPPEPGNTDIVPVPKFKLLKNLTDRSHINNIAERSRLWTKATAAPTGAKRKASGAPTKAPPAKQQVGGVGPAPPGFCKGFWHGTECRRPNCSQLHVNGRTLTLGNPRAGPQLQLPSQQQPSQPQWQPPGPQQAQTPPQPQPPLNPPQVQPQQPQQQQQQQQQAAPAPGTAQPRVGNYSFMVGGGRGGGGRGRGGGGAAGRGN